MERRAFIGTSGSSYTGLRDVYAQAGYPTDIDYKDYVFEYERHDIAHRIVSAFPDATWREKPAVVENENDEDSQFEKKFKKVVSGVNIYYYLHRADILANIGEYSIVFMGFDDVTNEEELSQPVTKATSLNFVQVYGYNNIGIDSYYSDITDKKYGKPEKYKITFKTLGAGGKTTKTMVVHESRVLHLAEGCLENDFIGTPRLKAVYNRLKDLDKILSASAEGFWRSAWPGLAAKKDPNVRWTDKSKEDVASQFQAYAHGMSRVMRLEGVDIQELIGRPASPKDHVYVNLELIAGTVNIPRRILTGSEMGEMASTQDRENWHDRIMERRNNWAVPHVIKQLIGKLSSSGVVDAPEDYIIKWDRSQHSERDQTEINKKKTSMIVAYAKEPSSQSIYSHYDFLVNILEHTPEQAKEIMKRSSYEEGDDE